MFGILREAYALQATEVCTGGEFQLRLGYPA